jgi:hypothetical protein
LHQIINIFKINLFEHQSVFQKEKLTQKQR